MSQPSTLIYVIVSGATSLKEERPTADAVRGHLNAAAEKFRGVNIEVYPTGRGYVEVCLSSRSWRVAENAASVATELLRSHGLDVQDTVQKTHIASPPHKLETRKVLQPPSIFKEGPLPLSRPAAPLPPRPKPAKATPERKTRGRFSHFRLGRFTSGQAGIVRALLAASRLLTPSELSRASGLSVASVKRFLETAVEEGHIDQVKVSGSQLAYGYILTADGREVASITMASIDETSSEESEGPPQEL